MEFVSNFLRPLHEYPSGGRQVNLTALSPYQGFWDSFAPWYERWLNRCLYHRPLLMDISRMAEAGWSILDIGAATGVLSLPLSGAGSVVTAIEPSEGMREIFSRKSGTSRAGNIQIIPSTWEDYLADREFDLAIACNSLHLTSGGIEDGMKKVFSAGATHICLITEINQNYIIDFKQMHARQDSHHFLSIKNYRVDSSYYFETMEEVLELEGILKQDISTVMLGGHPVWRDSSDIAVVWWEKK